MIDITPTQPQTFTGSYYSPTNTSPVTQTSSPTSTQTYTQGQNVGGGVVKYDSNTGALLSPGQSFTLPTPAGSQPNPTVQNITATTPVITASAAEKDYASKLANYQELTNAISQQKSLLAQQAAQKAADEAGKQAEQAKQSLEQAKLGIQQQTADTQAKDAEAKRKALEMANGTQSTPPETTAGISGTNTTTGTAGAPASTNPADIANAGLNTAVDQKINGLQTIQDARDANAQKSLNLLSSLAAGTIPLTASQQALVTSLQNQLVQNENDQKQANASYEGTINESNFRNGGEYTPEQSAGQIHAAISLGVQKIQNLDNSAAKTIADLEQSFQKDNFDIINKQYDILNKTLDDKASAIKDTYETVTNAIKDQRDQQQKVTESVNKVVADAAKNGADKATLAKIGSAKTESDAITAAADFLQTGTGTLGDYLQYKRDTQAKGLTPMDYQSYKDAEDAKAMKLKVSEAYSVKLAQNQADANSSASDKNQQKLEQQYRQVLSKEFSARTGALGIENAKVNQANHLNSIFTQYYDPKTGNYNIPTSQYGEVALGLANLVSGSGGASDTDVALIKQKTATGDIKGALSYITGTPQNGSTQAIFKNIVDSVDRQAATAARNREAALQNMRDQAPTDLEQSRIDKLNKSTEMVKYEGEDRIAKTTVTSYVKSNPKDAEAIAKLYEVPGATDADIVEYLKAQGKLQ